MRAIGFPLLAAASLLLAASSSAAATRPHYGGTLRVTMQARVASLDPRQWPAQSAEGAATERIASLVFDRLVRLDVNLHPEPALAISWEHDAEFKRWRFRLRPGVTFHDGEPLAAVVAAGALRAQMAAHYRVSVVEEWLVVQSEHASPNLLAELARGRHFIFRSAPDGTVLGTGPFRLAERQPERLELVANEDYWAGRPFLGRVVVEMGVTSSQQLLSLELGHVDLIELQPDQIRRAAQEGRVSSSAPVELLAVVFDASRPVGRDARLRQALALSIDRGAIHNVLLQRHGELAAGLLPQWLSGYAFLFAAHRSVERARDLVKEHGGPASLRVAYDARDALARAIAERIAVNAREAGVSVQTVAEGSTPPRAVDAKLARLRLNSVEPHAVLAELAVALGLELDLSPEGIVPERLYAAERTLLEDHQVIPLVHPTETYGLGRQVRNWTPLRQGGWRLEDIWLEPSAGRARESTGEPKP